MCATPYPSSFKKGSWRLRRDSLSVYFSKPITHNSTSFLGPGFLLLERAPRLKTIRFCSCMSSKLQKKKKKTNLQPKIRKINLIIVFLGPSPTSQYYQDWGCHKNLSVSLEALHLPASSWSHFVLVPYCLASEKKHFLKVKEADCGGSLLWIVLVSCAKGDESMKTKLTKISTVITACWRSFAFQAELEPAGISIPKRG